MSLKSFVAKYAVEAAGVAQALGSLVAGIALPSAEKDEVNEVIALLTQAAENITNGLDKVTEVKVSKADLEKIVKAYATELIDAAVTEAFAARDAEVEDEVAT